MDLFDIAVASKLAGGGGGGGSSNIIWHTFTPSDEETTQEITIPYTGDGYPIEVVIFTADSSAGTSSIYKPLQSLYVKKTDITTPPKYTGSEDDTVNITEVDKYNLTTSGRLAMTTVSSGKQFFNNTPPTTSNFYKTKMPAKNKLNIFIAENVSTNGGYMPGIEYTCIIKYSE